MIHLTYVSSNMIHLTYVSSKMTYLPSLAHNWPTHLAYLPTLAYLVHKWNNKMKKIKEEEEKKE